MIPYVVAIVGLLNYCGVGLWLFIDFENDFEKNNGKMPLWAFIVGAFLFCVFWPSFIIWGYFASGHKVQDQVDEHFHNLMKELRNQLKDSEVGKEEEGSGGAPSV